MNKNELINLPDNQYPTRQDMREIISLQDTVIKDLYLLLSEARDDVAECLSEDRRDRREDRITLREKLLSSIDDALEEYKELP